MRFTAATKTEDKSRSQWEVNFFFCDEIMVIMAGSRVIDHQREASLEEDATSLVMIKTCSSTDMFILLYQCSILTFERRMNQFCFRKFEVELTFILTI